MKVKGLVGYYANRDFAVDKGLIFGRNPNGCNVLFPDNVKGVSRTHCKIDKSDNGVTLTDLGSSYGTFYNGRKLVAYMPEPLNPGDEFWIGDRSNLFKLEESKKSLFGRQKAKNAKSSSDGSLSTGGKIRIGIVAVFIVALIYIVFNQQSKIKDQENAMLDQQSLIEDQLNEIRNQQNAITNQQNEIDRFNNRSPFEKIVDGVGGVFDIIH